MCCHCGSKALFNIIDYFFCSSFNQFLLQSVQAKRFYIRLDLIFLGFSFQDPSGQYSGFFSVQLAYRFEPCSPQHPRSYVLVVRMILRLRAPHARRGRAAQSLLSAVVAFSYPLLLRVLILRLPSMG